jgi:predicted nucleic acid-binding protein
MHHARTERQRGPRHVFALSLAGTEAAVTTPMTLVLDTNVVFDWLVFADPRCRALADALTAGRATWVTTAGMRDEAQRVVARGALAARLTEVHDLWGRWERWACVVDAPAAPLPHAPRCTDPDDQKFIDLALHVGAAALVSRDRAVLECAQRARGFGLSIVTPDSWLPA